MNRRNFLGLLGLLGCKDELENMNISKKLWWIGTTAEAEDETLLFGSDLSSQPADWSDTAEFTFTGGVLNSTGTPANTGWDSFAGWSYLSSQERQRTTVFFNINSSTSVFRVLKYNTNSWAKGGSVAEIDFENSLIKFYGYYLYPTPPTLSTSEPITLTINTAHDYKVEFSKIDLSSIIKLTNITTGESNTLTTGNSLFRGQVALQHVKGDIDYSGLYYYALNPSSPKIAVYGDSYVDGYSLTPDLEDRWAYRVFNFESGNAVISGWGGNSAADLLTRIKDWGSFTPKNVIISVGYNESVLQTWKDNLESLIRQFVSLGSNIILTTYAPMPAVAAFTNINAMNAYVLTRGYQILDIAALLTTGGDRVTLNGALVLPDNAHPNVDGHDLIYAAYLNLNLYNSQYINNGIISYFKLNANANDSTGLHNGTLVAAPSSVAGKINNAYSFNGSTQYISLADSTLLSFVMFLGGDVPLTFSVWVYPTSFAATNYIFTKRPAGGLEYSLRIATSGIPDFTLFSQGAGTSTIGVGGAAIPLNTWSHIVVTYDGNKLHTGLKMYINGVDVGSSGMTGTYLGMSNTSTSAYIGGLNGTAGGFTGRIDELGIWRRKLSATQVASLYNSDAGLAYENFITTP